MRRAITCLAAMAAVVAMPAASAGALPAAPAVALPGLVCEAAGTAGTTLGDSPLGGLLGTLVEALAPILGIAGEALGPATEGLCEPS